MTGNDPLDKGGSGAGKANDENRVGIEITGRTRGEPGAGLGSDDPIDLVDFGLWVVVYRSPVQVVPCRDVLESTCVFAEILEFLPEGKSELDLILAPDLPLPDQSCHFLSVIAVHRLRP